jgi:colanic acid biosynthesis glycosyl transferase WcaI
VALAQVDQWRPDTDERLGSGPESAPLRVLVHDFSGHPFQADLSRHLVDRGMQVVHVHCPSYQSGKGRLENARGLRVAEISVGPAFHRYSPVRRLWQECLYGLRFVRLVHKVSPDVVVSCNDPLIAKLLSGLWFSLTGQRWLYWLQDFYSLAMARELGRRGGRISSLAARLLQSAEGRLLRSSDGVIAITDDFLPLLRSWGVGLDKTYVEENWAPLGELPVCHRDNDWRRSLGLPDGPTFLYSGTLGLKHDSDLLYELAAALGEDGTVVVVSEGLGSDCLARRQGELPLDNLVLLPYQPYASLPEVLGSADVLLVLLDQEAGRFSVPSKVLTSLCAGRPILASIPAENLAARTILAAGAGRIARPGATEEFIATARALADDAELRHRLGRSGRAYAEEIFDSDRKAERFSQILEAVALPRRGPAPRFTFRGSDPRH